MRNKMSKNKMIKELRTDLKESIANNSRLSNELDFTYKQLKASEKERLKLSSIIEYLENRT